MKKQQAKKSARKQPKKLARKAAKAPARRVRSTRNDRSATTITLKLDSKTEQLWNRTSVVEAVRNLPATEAELLQRASEASGMSVEKIARDGMHLLAQRILAGAASQKAGRGVAGSADDRIAEAIEKCKQEGIPPTPSRVGRRADPPVGKRTVERYFARLEAQRAS